MKHLEEDMLCTLLDCNDVNGGKLLITSKTHLWSLSCYSDEGLSSNSRSRFLPFDDFFVSNDEFLPEVPDQTEPPLLKFNGDYPEISDVNLYLSADVMCYFKADLKELLRRLVKPSDTIEEVANINCCPGTTMTRSVHHSGNHVHCLPEGSLISLHGYVVAVYNYNCSSIAEPLSREIADVGQKSEVFHGIRTSVCIHLSVDGCTVKIFGALRNHAYLIGFGPGVNATFHRILFLSGWDDLMLTPASFIIVNSFMGANVNYNCCNSSVASGIQSFASVNTVPSGLISEISKCSENNPMQLHSRVVAIYILVFEKNSKLLYSDSRTQSNSYGINIPLAGFVLEDGSSSCYCWANNERAATLLRLHEEVPHNVSGRNFWKSKENKEGRNHGSGFHHIKELLKKHGRIVVKNYGSLFDSSCQDLTFSVGTDNIISYSEENLLKLIFLNACFGTFWTVVGNLLDSNATGRVENYCREMEMTMHPIHNIWAREVYHGNPLTEARNRIQELMER